MSEFDVVVLTHVVLSGVFLAVVAYYAWSDL